mgnify:CR=1 FL=1
MSLAEKITVEELEADPYPFYAHLRREAPVCFVPSVNLWMVTRWADVEFVAKTPELFTAEVAASPVERTFGKPTILTTDGPVHKELRAGIDPKYKPKPVAAYIDGLVRPIAEEYLSSLLKRGGGDLMAEYFEPISTLSLARSFGFHDIDVPTLRRWFYGLAQGAINFENDPARQAIGDAVSAEISAKAEAIFARLEQTPDDSALSHMLHDGMPAGQTRPRQLDGLVCGALAQLLTELRHDIGIGILAQRGPHGFGVDGLRQLAALHHLPHQAPDARLHAVEVAALAGDPGLADGAPGGELGQRLRDGAGAHLQALGQGRHVERVRRQEEHGPEATHLALEAPELHQLAHGLRYLELHPPELGRIERDGRVVRGLRSGRAQCSDWSVHAFRTFKSS